MVGSAYLSIGKAHGAALLMDQGVGLDVAVRQIFHDLDSGGQVRLAGRPSAKEIGIGGIDVGFIDGDIVAAKITKTINDQLHQLQIMVEILPFLKSTQVFESHRI